MKRDFVYLASASPRRRTLLEQLGVPFRVRPAAIHERRAGGEAPETCAMRLANAKAAAVWASLTAGEARPVLAADTLVVIGDEVLGKPAGFDDAMAMLARLSGRTHRVLTAVVLRYRERALSRLNATEVRFRATTDAERMAYCETGEPMGKAGSYAIQGRGAVFVEHLSGSYSSVVGLPLAETATLLEALGFPVWRGH